MNRAADIGLYRTMGNTIGAVHFDVVRPPRGLTPLDPPAAASSRVRLLLPIDEGMVVREDGGAQYLVGRHDLAWVPPRRRVSALLARPTSLALVSLPSDVFERHGLSLAQLPPRTHPTSPLVQPVREFLLSAIDNSLDVEVISAHLFEQMIAELVESLALEAKGMPTARGQVRPSTYDQAVAHITAFRASPDLTPQQVAGSLRVSIRHLQRAFEERGATVAGEIRRQRTEAAVQMLSDTGFDDVKMPEIAARAGFGNDAEMRRAVAAWMGTTPSRLRSAVTARGRERE